MMKGMRAAACAVLLAGCANGAATATNPVRLSPAPMAAINADMPIATARPASHAASEGSVVVARGDTLGAIARRAYGDPACAGAIARANAAQIANPNVIAVGQTLRLPAVQGCRVRR